MIHLQSDWFDVIREGGSFWVNALKGEKKIFGRVPVEEMKCAGFNVFLYDVERNINKSIAARMRVECQEIGMNMDFIAPNYNYSNPVVKKNLRLSYVAATPEMLLFGCDGDSMTLCDLQSKSYNYIIGDFTTASFLANVLVCSAELNCVKIWRLDRENVTFNIDDDLEDLDIKVNESCIKSIGSVVVSWDVPLTHCLESYESGRKIVTLSNKSFSVYSTSKQALITKINCPNNLDFLNLSVEDSKAYFTTQKSFGQIDLESNSLAWNRPFEKSSPSCILSQKNNIIIGCDTGIQVYDHRMIADPIETVNVSDVLDVVETSSGIAVSTADGSCFNYEWNGLKLDTKLSFSGSDCLPSRAMCTNSNKDILFIASDDGMVREYNLE